MRKILICVITFIFIFVNTINIFADELNMASFKMSADNNETAIVEENLITDIDNSDLLVEVKKEEQGNLTTIYSGALSGYDSGKWINVDFSEINYLILLECNKNGVDTIYIIPKENQENANANIEKKNIQNNDMIETTLDLKSAVYSPIYNIKCDVNLMYDGNYNEKIMIKNKELNIPIKVTNTSNEEATVTCYIAEYDSNGVLIGAVSSSDITVSAKQSVATNITKTFSSKAETAKIFIWDNDTIRPITNSINLTETNEDYYSNDFYNAQMYDISHYINGSINTVGDVDYIKFTPEIGGYHTINCISSSDVQVTLYDSGHRVIEKNISICKRMLQQEEEYYIKIFSESNKTGEYILNIQYGASDEADEFSIYDFDIDTNVYKKAVLNMCEDLYYNDIEASKQMYNKYEAILKEEANLHQLPDFLSDHPKDLSNFDEIVNQYYSTKYDELMAVQNKYLSLIDEYTDIESETPMQMATNNEEDNGIVDIDIRHSIINDDIKNSIFDDKIRTKSVSAEVEHKIIGEKDIDNIIDAKARDEVINVEHPIIGKHISDIHSINDIEENNGVETYSSEEEYSDIEKRDANVLKTSALQNSNASLVITDKTSTSITYNVTFPNSGATGNEIWLIDFNASNGLTREYNVYGKYAIYQKNGTYTINNLQPCGIYILEMHWSTDGGYNFGYDNSICRFVKLPCNTTRTLQMYEGAGRVSAKLEPEDKALASDRDFDKWLERMDKAYNAFKELTGYTPYNAQKIVMKSTRKNLNERFDDVDGENYWWVTFGYYDGTRIFKHSKAFNQGLMRRLSQDDWGDTPMRELSHVFDYYSWEFDSETLAQFKLYYVVSTLNAKVYRPDRFNNNGNGWYTGTNYYTLLKTDRYLDSYTNSFDIGNIS